jgi:hypothetical protein
MFIDPNDAVLHELKRIADAVSKPAPSSWLDWLKTLATFILGLATAFLSQQLQGWLGDDREQTKMRRVVYLELSRNFIDLDFMVAKNWNDDGTPILNGVRWKILNPFLTFDGERLMNEDKKLFYELKEGEVLKQIYYWFHHLDIPKADGTNKFGLSEMRGPLSFFSDRFRAYQTFRQHLKKLLPAVDFEFIQQRIRLYKHVFSTEELVDSGQLVVVDTNSRAPGDDSPG